MPRKTVRFTYEGSSKFCKIIYLIGATIISIGDWTLIGSIFYGIYNIFTNHTHNTGQNAIAWIVIIFAFYVVTNIVGSIIISISQFINWWDRGSVNTTITRNLKK